MTTLLKKVEQEDIILGDCEVGQFNWKILGVLLTIIGISLAYLCFKPPTTMNEIGVLHGFFSIFAIMGVLGGVTIIILGGCNTGVPGYRIWILGDLDSERCIVKTTQEQDQKTICRIANELESRAREKSKKERELKQIAQGCK